MVGMRLAHLTLIAATPALLVALTACGSSSDSSKATTSTSTAAKTTTTTAAQPTGTSVVPPPPPPTPRPTPHPTGDVNCGAITGANGQSADVIAYSSQAGIPGCTEAITVASDYVNATRTGDAVAVDGWTCEPQPDTVVPRICFKDGFLIGLRGAAAPLSPPPPPPPPTTTSTPPEPVVEDVNCGTVTDAGGGTRSVIAVGGPAGRVGCTEAINVATQYVQTISTSDVAVIDGWNCNAQPDPNMPSMCAKDGLVIGLGN